MPSENERPKSPEHVLDRIASISRELTGLQSLADIGAVGVRGVVGALGCERAALVVRRGNEMRLAATHGFPAPPADRTELTPETVDAVLREHLGERYLGVPLLAHGELMGTLAIDRGENREDDPPAWLLSAVGDQLALALFHTPEEVVESLEQELRETQEEARLRRLALDGLGHDLRSPLNALHLNCQLLTSEALGPLTEEQRETLASMGRSIESAASLVTQMLELGRLDSERSAFKRERFDLFALCSECRDELRAETSKNRQIVTLRGDGPVEVLADRSKAKQVILNLLGNAAKYSPEETSIEVEVDLLLDRKRGRVVIGDEGPGIPEEERGQVFAPYFRVTTTESQKGMGLGLTISRELARRMNGEVELLPSERGARFSVTLPIARRGEPTEPTGAPEGGDG